MKEKIPYGELVDIPPTQPTFKGPFLLLSFICTYSIELFCRIHLNKFLPYKLLSKHVTSWIIDSSMVSLPANLKHVYIRIYYVLTITAIVTWLILSKISILILDLWLGTCNNALCCCSLISFFKNIMNCCHNSSPSNLWSHVFDRHCVILLALSNLYIRCIVFLLCSLLSMWCLFDSFSRYFMIFIWRNPSTILAGFLTF